MMAGPELGVVFSFTVTYVFGVTSAVGVTSGCFNT